MPPKYYKNIRTPNDLRVILSRCINMLLLDQLDSSVANSIASLSNTMLKVLKATELEDRIKKLEEQQENDQSESYSPVTSDIQAKIRELRN
jgi:hypothetical protein